MKIVNLLKPLTLSLALLFGACAAQPPPAAAPGLAGTHWQLVKFAGGDDTVLMPDDGGKYTITFAADGRVTVRLDCNRGSASWKSPTPGQLELGTLALTRAMCPPGSMHDQMARQWPYLRSYIIKENRLFLSLMADGGIYEFERTAAE